MDRFAAVFDHRSAVAVAFDLSGNDAHSVRCAALRHETEVPWHAEYSRENQETGGTIVPNPALRAKTIACARFSTPSLAKMLVMWLRTVLALTPNCAAIWLLSRPCAINSVKSSSRGVSEPNAGSRISVVGKNARNSATHRDHAGSPSSRR